MSEISKILGAIARRWGRPGIEEGEGAAQPMAPKILEILEILEIAVLFFLGGGHLLGSVGNL